MASHSYIDVVAVPVAPPETCEAVRAEVDEIVCALTPVAFYGVERWCEDFLQTTDDEVRELPGRTARRVSHGLRIDSASLLAVGGKSERRKS
jgi:predicted phosphoribosyltransferase